MEHLLNNSKVQSVPKGNKLTELTNYIGVCLKDT